MRLGSFLADRVPDSSVNSLPTHLADITTRRTGDLYRLRPTAHFEQDSGAPKSL
jgi:hypothetical protein